MSEVVITATFEKLKKELKDALPDIAAAGVNAIKSDCPVDTGNLRNHITGEVSGDSIIWVSGVEYSSYLEFGTSRMSANPFMRRFRDTWVRQNVPIMLKGAIK